MGRLALGHVLYGEAQQSKLMAVFRVGTKIVPPYRAVGLRVAQPNLPATLFYSDGALSGAGSVARNNG